ncbi:MAG: SagB/ThcOx family dehydrogenase [Desulfobacterota bacterium]|nr:SagB/ThcOx family dehydrogenase [Thermodesulfobacteriota bacterium]
MRSVVKIAMLIFIALAIGGIMEVKGSEFIALPEPAKKGSMSLEESIFLRRSVREFSDTALTINELSQLLWASQGTVKSGRRSVPSAGALYPLEIYAVCGNVKGIEPGIYKYDVKRHGLVRILSGDRRAALASSALGQYWVKNAPVSIVVSAVYERTTRKYGERGIRYVHMEVGHVGQNVLLQAVALNLGAVPVGAFYDEDVKRVLNLPKDEHPLYIIPVGKER